MTNSRPPSRASTASSRSGPWLQAFIDIPRACVCESYPCVYLQVGAMYIQSRASRDAYIRYTRNRSTHEGRELAAFITAFSPCHGFSLRHAFTPAPSSTCQPGVLSFPPDLSPMAGQLFSQALGFLSLRRHVCCCCCCCY